MKRLFSLTILFLLLGFSDAAKSQTVGGLGMVGIPAAIANAVFHATGKRIRELPITPDKLL